MKLNSLLLCAFSLWLLGVPETVATPLPPSAIAQFSGEEQTGINVYKIASPAVVTISIGTGVGSGSIISSEGLVLTDNHVIRGARGGQVTVRTANGKRYVGRVIATDRGNDLALVQILARERFPTLRLASASGIQVGQRVYAIGSPFGLSGTFTTGILSRIGRNGDLQTDAAINPGNSGGPLLNSRGELIGVNRAILSPDGGGNIGIGFATSALVAGNFIQQSLSGINPGLTAGSPAPSTRRLGISVDSALVIQDIEPGSVASELGLRPGDQLIAINGSRLRSVQQLQAFLDSRPTAAVFTVARNRRLANVRVDF